MSQEFALSTSPIKPEIKNVERVYSGRIGCMCGCRGNYSEHKSTVTRLFNRLLTAPETKVEVSDLGRPTAKIEYMHAQIDGRQLCVYFK